MATLSHNLMRKLVIILFFATFLTVAINTIYSPIYGDEGFYHGDARGKNVYGYYTSPYLYDIPVFQGHSYYQINRSIIQVYRITDTLFDNAIYGIKTLRVLSFILFVWALWFYLKKSDHGFETLEKLGILGVIISYPIITVNFLTGREEVILSSLMLFILGVYRSGIENKVRNINVLFLSALMFFFHPNGILYLGILGIVGTEYKKPVQTLKLWALILSVTIIYYLIFIDANYTLYIKQSRAMYESRDVEKIITTISSLPRYVLAEIRDRYFMWSAKGYPRYPVLILSMIVPLLAGLYSGFKSRMFKMELVYIISTMVFFVILGSKNSGYLIYFYPVLIIMSFCLFRNRKKYLACTFTIIMVVNMTLITRHIVWSYYDHSKVNTILSIIDNNATPGETIYAPSNWEPYLSSKYRYLMTTHKDVAKVYQSYNIKPKNCVIMEQENNEIWKWANGEREKIATIGNLSIYRIR